MPNTPLEKELSCIGLGLLGSAMTSRLIEFGWRVRGSDISLERREAFTHAGGEAAESSIEAAQSSLIMLSLPTSDIVGTVLCEIGPELKPGTIIVDTTTGRPEEMETFARQLAERGVAYLDATVGGSSQLARDGEAIVMCGGERAAFDQCQSLFADLASKAFYCGPSGSGARMKLVVNLVLGLNRAVLAEGLAFAGQLGIDGGQALEVLKAGPSWSRAMDHKGERMLTENFEPQARLAQHRKDVRLILELAGESNAAVPFSSLHEELLSRLVDQGDGDLDNSAIIRAFQTGGE